MGRKVYSMAARVRESRGAWGQGRREAGKPGSRGAMGEKIGKSELEVAVRFNRRARGEFIFQVLTAVKSVSIV